MAIVEDKPRRAGRRVDSVAVNITMERDAVQLLRRLRPPGTKGSGRLLARLLYEHAAKLEERERIEKLIAGGSQEA